MSDSDDTDILLLIPPDFYITTIEENNLIETELSQQKSQQEHQLKTVAYPSSVDSFIGSVSSTLEDIDYDCVNNFCCYCHSLGSCMKTMNAKETNTQSNSQDALAMPPPKSTYQFLPSRRKAELNHINSHLSALEHEQMTAPSDISTISNCTIRTQQGNAHKQTNFEQQSVLVHSTPKYKHMPVEQELNTVGHTNDVGVLNEIDHFLGCGTQRNSLNGNCSNHIPDRKHHISDEYPRHSGKCEENDRQEAHAFSLPNSLNRLNLEHQFNTCLDNAQSETKEQDKLISLSEIWGNGFDGQVGRGVGGIGSSGIDTVVTTSTISASLKEEQLRRQHLEKKIFTLQSRLLEYQQRLSVAIDVDRSKDSALAGTKMENKSLKNELSELKEKFYRIDCEHQQCSRKQDIVQNELAQAVDLASKSQAKNEKLETELGHVSRKFNELNNLYKKETDELERKLQNSKASEKLALDESNKYKDKLAKSEYQFEQLKSQFADLEKENCTVRQQKELLQDYHQKQKNRADDLEYQKKSLQETIKNLTQNEIDLKKKLDLQQKTLKTHYQQQLENVVAQKLKEFQEQLDKTEENLRSEARDREHLIADRAVKQLELINEKNELELKLLQEKHNEEVELYRIQLATASKKISDLEIKLEAYKSRRADIAEKLHDVMEAQWQKALEILTSPNQSKKNANESDVADGTDKTIKHLNSSSETPKTSKTKDVVGDGTQSPPMDRLQAYIELLLSKSPSDFKKLDEILALSKKAKIREEKAGRRNNNGKPPWRA